jgi:GH25 family lysozyme M1 (1,4-beta-N-acetylmuramidase)
LIFQKGRDILSQTILDVSRYQSTIDWQKVKDSGAVDGVMLKTVSTNKKLSTRADGLYIDPTFEANYAACKALGIPVGVYYYTYAQTKEQATAELSVLRNAIRGKKFELPIAVDVEDNKLKPLSADALTDLVIWAENTIEAWGYYAMVYTYTSYANTELNMDRLENYDLWIADYRSTRPTITHGMWQYTSKATVDGISGNVDMSHAYKDYPAIIKNAGLNGIK